MIATHSKHHTMHMPHQLDLIDYLIQEEGHKHKNRKRYMRKDPRQTELPLFPAKH